jgi:hypothetical protein
MSSTNLDTPFLDGGIHTTNFFNGRILSREDMQREQDAVRAVHERIGRAVGVGIAGGFFVEAKAIGGSSVANPVVTVHAGMALNAHGQTVALDADVDVSLLKPTAPQSTGTVLAGSFNDCEPPESTVYVAGTGVYLLTVAPASVKKGLAIVSGLGNESAKCNAKEVIEGVQFRLFSVTAGLSDEERADEARLRNTVAYKFFFAGGIGTAGARDPFGGGTALTQLTDVPLTDCDVPLALLHWTDAGGLRWVDNWSVRRRIAAVSDGSGMMLPDAQLVALGEAMLHQFAEQIESMLTQGPLVAHAADAFRWLPPVGLLPLAGVGKSFGFTSHDFFQGFTTRGPLFIEGARIPSLQRLARAYPPIKVGDPELVWMYLVRENRQPAANKPPAQPYLVFSLGRLPCQVAPRFDVSHWDYANYALEDELISF